MNTHWPVIPAHIPFTGNHMDRVDQVRVHGDRLAAAWADPRTQIVLLDGLDPVIAPGGMLATMAPSADARMEDHALLGVREADGAPLFVDIAAPRSGGSPVFTSRLPAMHEQLRPDQLALYGGARSLVDWHRRHRFCAACGAPSLPVKAGWSRRCDTCQTEHFPRTDPVVIMLAEYKDRALVGRGVHFPPGRYSALAGFVEPGESFEEAVRRELWEETGIRVGRVDYLASQPWPFPSQLMIACIAQAHDDALTLDTEEIADAIWVSRDEVRAALADEEGARFGAPPPVAIAHHMLRHWLENGRD